MDAKEKGEFGRALGALGITMGVQIEDGMLYGYWLGLSDLPLADVKAAIAEAIRSCKFMPRPAELRELTGRSGKADAALSWLRVRRAIREVGSYGSVDFGPEVNAAIRLLGGWRSLCMADSDDLDGKRKAFDEALSVAWRAADTEKTPLIGSEGRPPVKFLPPKSAETGSEVALVPRSEP